MKKIVVVIIMFSFVGIVFTGCRTLTGRSAGEVIDDSTITTEINAKIIEEPDLDYLKINVNSFQGNVTLTGTVPSRKAEMRLIEISRNVDGVKSVKSNLKIE